VESYLLAHEGNNVNLLATGRVPARRQLLVQYDAIRGRYHHLLFRGQLIRNLLGGRPWYVGYDQIFATHRSELFIGEGARDFAFDARKKLDTEFAASGLGVSGPRGDQ